MRFFLPLLCLLPLAAPAQPEVPRFAFKLNVSPLLNPAKQALALAVDVRLASRFSADAGAGFFFASTAFANEKGESYRGLRLRAGLKYYFNTSDGDVFHLGIEGKYQDIRNISIREVFRQGLQYTEILPMKRRVRMSGVAARVGWPRFFGSRRQFVVEPFVGLGILWLDVTRELPPDAELFGDEAFILYELGPGKRSIPDVFFGVHLGVALW